MVAQGAQKFTRRFGGFGVRGAAQFFQSIGYPAGTAMGAHRRRDRGGAGAALAAGILTPLASAALVGLFLNVAVAGHADGGFWNHNNPPGGLSSRPSSGSSPRPSHTREAGRFLRRRHAGLGAGTAKSATSAATTFFTTPPPTPCLLSVDEAFELGRLTNQLRAPDALSR